MALHLKQLSDIDESVYQLNYMGMTHQKEMVDVYQKITLLRNLRFLIADGTQMIYSASTMQSQLLSEMRLQTLAKPTFEMVFLVAPEHHSIRPMITKVYENMGYAHKMQLVKTTEEALTVIRQRLNKP